jgi:hypothetical protein
MDRQLIAHIGRLVDTCGAAALLVLGLGAAATASLALAAA